MSLLDGASSANCASYIASWDEKVVRVWSTSVLDLMLERHRTERYVLAIPDEVWCGGGHRRFYPHHCGSHGWKGEKKLPSSATFPSAISGSRDRPSTFGRIRTAFSLWSFEPSHARLHVCLPRHPRCCSYLDKSFRAMWTVSRSQPLDGIVPSRHTSSFTRNHGINPVDLLASETWPVEERLGRPPSVSGGSPPPPEISKSSHFFFFSFLFVSLFLRRDLSEMRISADPGPTWSAFRALDRLLISLLPRQSFETDRVVWKSDFRRVDRVPGGGSDTFVAITSRRVDGERARGRASQRTWDVEEAAETCVERACSDERELATWWNDASVVGRRRRSHHQHVLETWRRVRSGAAKATRTRVLHGCGRWNVRGRNCAWWTCRSRR